MSPYPPDESTGWKASRLSTAACFFASAVTANGRSGRPGSASWGATISVLWRENSMRSNLLGASPGSTEATAVLFLEIEAGRPGFVQPLGRNGVDVPLAQQHVGGAVQLH